ncbi:MAG: MFS transporter [Christensenellales bacterium]
MDTAFNIAKRDRRVGYITFFFSGICAISSGIIVSMLQEKYNFSFSLTGSLLTFLSIGNMAAAFLSGLLPKKIGVRRTVLLLCSGYFIGYLLTAFIGWPGLLLAAFLMIGLAKGCALNNCNVLIGRHSENRSRSMQILHACYALGALLCPVIISALALGNAELPIIGVALCGLIMWGIFAFAKLPGKPEKTSDNTNNVSRDFLHSADFWLLTALVFCQNAAETSVSGWLVTYYREQQILSGALSIYTMTIMWGATLIARLIIAFMLHIKDNFKALLFMGIGCTALYAAMIPISSPIPASAALFAFSFAMAGINPMSTASVGKYISQESMGVMLPIGAVGAIIMPLIIGVTADSFGLQTGMMMNLIPCLGIAVISGILYKRNRSAVKA